MRHVHGERHQSTNFQTQEHQQLSRDEAHLTDQATSLSVLPVSRAVLRIVEIVAPDAVEFGALQEHSE